MTVDTGTVKAIARELFAAREAVRTVPYVSPRLPEHDLDGLRIEIMSPEQATAFSLERIRRGENTISYWSSQKPTALSRSSTPPRVNRCVRAPAARRGPRVVSTRLR